MILTSNTEATEKVQFFNLAYRVKEFQCHSNNSATAWKENNNNVTHNALTQLDMHLHRLTFAVVEWTMYFQVNTVAQGL